RGPALYCILKLAMTTTSEVATSAKLPVELPAKLADRRMSSRLLPVVGVTAMLGLVGFNVWWFWRDTRPLPDLAVIARLMGHDQYAQAEPALREHLRRSPHDGEARMMLARAYAAGGRLLECAQELHDVPYWWPQKAEALYRE